MSSYNFTEIEKKWQNYWDENSTFKVTEDPSFPKEKRMYVLDMFPYPSGAGLHVGHPEGYTATDMYCRYLRMNGYNVLHPMGFDSFGLPAENYAIKTGTHPETTTMANIENFRRQIKSLGFCYDWDREVSTHTPEYYKWTQWIFLQLYKKGLAYEAETPINWCPDCKTGLANEEVKDGGCDRCGTKVTRKNLRQWMFQITEYGDSLLEGLNDINWTDSVKAMQNNWIGRSEGANVKFKLENGEGDIEVYTTRPDTLFGATYMVLSPEHNLVEMITTDDQKQAVEDYKIQAALKSDLERTDLAKGKTGVFTGSYAINPVNGDKIPVWISDYILISYGTGAIMAVPAHDERDWEFAKTFDLPIKQVVSKDGNIEAELEEVFPAKDGIAVNSGRFDGMKTKEAIPAIIKWLDEEKIGFKSVNYKLRDWVFSRQRYWGEPIPLIHCPTCGTVPVPEDQLPLELPNVTTYEPSGTGESPLANIDDWVNCDCPVCGEKSKRETNTMPQWAGSCWYYLRYIDPNNQEVFVSKEKEEYWMPVGLYVGGAEHAVLHLLYSRFWHHVLHDLGLVSTREPFHRLINQGMILGEGGIKMSKSLGNVINPDDVINEYGADSMRLYEMFMGPLEVTKPWNTQGITGVYKFLNRVWNMANREVSEEDPSKEQLKSLHKTIKKLTNDTSKLEFNTGIAQMMIFVNENYKDEQVNRATFEQFIKLLAPYTPHIAEEIWEILGHKTSIANESWPEFVEELTKDDEVTIVVQVNGKLRAKLQMPSDISKEDMEKAAFDDEHIKTHTQGKNIVKVIAVPGKLVNIVAK